MRLDEKQVTQALQRLDSRLYLDKLFDKERGYLFYAVRYTIEPGIEPLTCIEWRDLDGPRPLSLDIVTAVERQEGSVHEAIQKAIVNNSMLKDKRLREIHEAQDEELEWIKKSSKRLGLYGPWSNKANLK